MTRKMMTRLLALLLCAVMSIALCACAQTPQSEPTEVVETQVETTATDALWESAVYTADTTLGEGKKSVNIEVQALDKAITVTIKTDAKNLEDALTSVDLVQGDESEYGLFIKTVNGILADYDTDGAYWSINQNGEYMMSGASETKIKDGDSFELVYTK